MCPVVDGDVLTETPWTALTAARADGVELLVGHTRDEIRLFSVMTGRRGTFTEEQARTTLDVFAPAPHGPDAYRAAHPHASPEELLETVYSDATFRMPSLLLAEANYAAGGGSSFLFELQLTCPAFGGACHGLDVPLAFGTLDSHTGKQLFGDEPAPEAVAVSRELQQAWARFAATGDPGWPAFDSGRQLTRILAAESRTAPYPEQTSRHIWRGRPPAPFDLAS